MGMEHIYIEYGSKGLEQREDLHKGVAFASTDWLPAP